MDLILNGILNTLITEMRDKTLPGPELATGCGTNLHSSAKVLK